MALKILRKYVNFNMNESGMIEVLYYRFKPHEVESI